MNSYRSVLLMGVLLLGSSVAAAGEGWNSRLAFYAWFAGLNGDVATIPGLPAAPVDVSPSEALKDTEASLMLMFSTKKGRHGVFGDLVYSDVRSSETLAPEIGLKLKTTSKTTLLSLAYQNEVYGRQGTTLDLMAGARYWDIDTQLRFEAGQGPLDGRKISHDESWIDPLVGVKGQVPLGGSRFFLAGGAAVGGFGIGSDLFYEINANVGYRWTEAIGTTVGYRMFDVDYDDDGFTYDVRQDGWQVGLTWDF